LRFPLPGYARLDAGGARGIVLESCKGTFESILASETLYAFASRQPDARRFTGRAPVYAIEFPEYGNVVVRRSMRGGALARLRTDLFFPPTRALRELLTSIKLRVAGVATPEIVGFASYRAGPIFRRSDVVSREISGGADLSLALARHDDSGRRQDVLEATAVLVAALSGMGAHHADLSLRNVLVTSDESGESTQTTSHILDVDRIRFHIPGDPIVLSANIERLERSIRKWSDPLGLAVTESELATLRARIRDLAA
jgi:hypothetical protein